MYNSFHLSILYTDFIIPDLHKSFGLGTNYSYSIYCQIIYTTWSVLFFEENTSKSIDRRR
ncbi:MAG: hypothetical protein BAJATHORv1_40238 [Candidatus Thorarchaeota archaeon]|nr:MAG: hypothetical protein BAJATHORv1_40238 [Candidatus Thorarchaeota archaeon]